MRLVYSSIQILLLAVPVLLAPAVSVAQVVPGTGTLVNKDDFENSNFSFDHKWPKSSKEEDEQVRYPLGQSNTNMWFESPKRGAPDSVKWVEAPAGALPGSMGCLYMRSRDTGVPGNPGANLRKSGKDRMNQAQDDLIMKAVPMSVSASPNCMVRVYLPEWDQWEQRNGVSFGMRAGLQGPKETEKEVNFGRRLFRGKRTQKVTEMEPFYPGFFIHFVPANDRMNKTGKPYAFLLIRADEMGHEIQGPTINEPGWWTLGMSVTPDARVHYYAKPGVEDLTSRDLIRSTLPYSAIGLRATHFNTIFFNVVSVDDGKTWSTPWIIDDPMIFSANGGRPVQQASRR